MNRTQQTSMNAIISIFHNLHLMKFMVILFLLKMLNMYLNQMIEVFFGLGIQQLVDIVLIIQI